MNSKQIRKLEREKLIAMGVVKPKKKRDKSKGFGYGKHEEN